MVKTIMRTATIIFYFVLAIVIFASIGVWLPYCFEVMKGSDHKQYDIVQNLVTYFIAIFVSASLDYILTVIDKQLASKKLILLGVVLVNVLIYFGTAYILFKNSSGKSVNVVGYAVLGVIISYVMWWIANFKNSNFDPVDALGGNASQTLSNG